MRPSSFVFVAIVGLWAAHLLPQWIRRRDALGASRGGDRHSSALRVLARRRRPRTLGRSSAPLLPSIPVVTGPVAEAPVAGPVSFLSTGPGRAPAPAVGDRVGRRASSSPPRRRRVVLVALGGFAAASVLGAIAARRPRCPSGRRRRPAARAGCRRAARRRRWRGSAAGPPRSSVPRRDAEAERARRVRAVREAAGPGRAPWLPPLSWRCPMSRRRRSGSRRRPRARRWPTAPGRPCRCLRRPTR